MRKIEKSCFFKYIRISVYNYIINSILAVLAQKTKFHNSILLADKETNINVMKNVMAKDDLQDIKQKENLLKGQIFQN